MAEEFSIHEKFARKKHNQLQRVSLLFSNSTSCKIRRKREDQCLNLLQKLLKLTGWFLKKRDISTSKILTYQFCSPYTLRNQNKKYLKASKERTIS